MTTPAGSARVAILVSLLSLAQACSTATQPAPKFSSAQPPVAEPELASLLDRALKRGETGKAFYSARVVELKTGRELYAVDTDRPVMPASNGKLAVGAATLDFF